MTKYFLVIAILMLFSCKKSDNIPEDNRCTNILVETGSTQLLSNQEMDSIEYLFAKNSLSKSNLQFYNFLRDNETGNRYVHSYLFVNNIKVFTSYLLYVFNNQDSLVYATGEKITNIDLPNSQNMSKAEVRGIFIHELEKDDLYLNIFKNKDTIENGCIDIEFGYYDLNSGVSFQPVNYTTAWFVKPHNRDYPITYIDDLRKQIIYYFDGIIIN